MQVTIKGHVYAGTTAHAVSPHRFTFYGAKIDFDWLLYVGEHSFTYEVPAGWNPVAVEVAALEDQKKKALEDFQRTVAQINERLSKLQAITNEVTA